MALSLQFPVTTSTLRTPSVLSKPPPVCQLKMKAPLLTITNRSKQSRNQFKILKAIEESKESSTQSETVKQPELIEETELSELGAEIKKAMTERKEREGEGGLWSGVSEEIREIEWPVFGKVLGTTGVVLGVIAGSSVVLLTVNFVLAELSDKVFAGRGFQDFFS